MLGRARFTAISMDSEEGFSNYNRKKSGTGCRTVKSQGRLKHEEHERKKDGSD